MTVEQEDLTRETTKKVLDDFAKGTIPKPGPTSGRHTIENSAGLTALTSKVCPCPWGNLLAHSFAAIRTWRTLHARVSVVVLYVSYRRFIYQQDCTIEKHYKSKSESESSPFRALDRIFEAGLSCSSSSSSSSLFAGGGGR